MNYLLFIISWVINSLIYSETDIPFSLEYLSIWDFISTFNLSFTFSLFGSDVVLVLTTPFVIVGRIRIRRMLWRLSSALQSIPINPHLGLSVHRVLLLLIRSVYSVQSIVFNQFINISDSFICLTASVR